MNIVIPDAVSKSIVIEKMVSALTSADITKISLVKEIVDIETLPAYTEDAMVILSQRIIDLKKANEEGNKEYNKALNDVLHIIYDTLLLRENNNK